MIRALTPAATGHGREGPVGSVGDEARALIDDADVLGGDSEAEMLIMFDEELKIGRFGVGPATTATLSESSRAGAGGCRPLDSVGRGLVGAGLGLAVAGGDLVAFGGGA